MKAFCTLIEGAGFHPQSNGQSEQANQDLETTLRCLVPANPTTLSQQLVWVEYACNTLPCSATGLSPFECSLRYQPPLFPEQEEEVSLPCSATGFSPIECLLGYQPPLFPEQEEEVSLPSAQMFIRCCLRTWKRARVELLKTTSGYRRQADRHWTSASCYRLSQRIWLSTRDLPLRVDSGKLPPPFHRP